MNNGSLFVVSPSSSSTIPAHTTTIQSPKKPAEEIIEELKGSLKELLSLYSSEEPVASLSSEVCFFLYTLERIFCHGLQEPFHRITYIAVWDFLQTLPLSLPGTSHIIDNVNASRCKSPVERVRLFIRLACNQSEFVDYFCALMWNNEISSKFYTPNSINRDEEHLNTVQMLLETVRTLHFRLPLWEKLDEDFQFIRAPRSVVHKKLEAPPIQKQSYIEASKAASKKAKKRIVSPERNNDPHPPICSPPPSSSLTVSLPQAVANGTSGRTSASSSATFPSSPSSFLTTFSSHATRSRAIPSASGTEVPNSSSAAGGVSPSDSTYQSLFDLIQAEQPLEPPFSSSRISSTPPSTSFTHSTHSFPEDRVSSAYPTSSSSAATSVKASATATRHKSLSVSENRSKPLLNNHQLRPFPLSRPVWIPDSHFSNCGYCTSSFSITNRRHHCRSCGGIFCSRCCSRKMPLPNLDYWDPVLVCQSCVENFYG